MTKPSCEICHRQEAEVSLLYRGGTIRNACCACGANSGALSSSPHLRKGPPPEKKEVLQAVPTATIVPMGPAEPLNVDEGSDPESGICQMNGCDAAANWLARRTLKNRDDENEDGEGDEDGEEVFAFCHTHAAQAKKHQWPEVTMLKPPGAA